jgi:hypothetical protein
LKAHCYKLNFHIVNPRITTKEKKSMLTQKQQNHKK